MRLKFAIEAAYQPSDSDHVMRRTVIDKLIKQPERR